MKFKSALVTQVSGSVGGMTGSHNAGGMYFRARAIPTDPATTFQNVVRGFMSQLSNLWVNILTPAQRTAWEDYAAAVPITDALGDPINIAGNAMYIRSNLPRLQAGLPRVDSGPTILDLGDFTQPTAPNVDVAAQEFDVNFTDTDGWANEDDAAMIVLIGRTKNPTINFNKGPYRFAGKIDGDAITPPVSPAAIALPFVGVTGLRNFAQIRVSRADGRLSNPFRYFGTGV
jgi:hypothetical protein